MPKLKCVLEHKYKHRRALPPMWDVPIQKRCAILCLGYGLEPVWLSPLQTPHGYGPLVRGVKAFMYGMAKAGRERGTIDQNR